MSHHPPISACIAENENYRYHMDTHTTMSLSWGGTLSAKPIGYQHVFLKDHGEHYLIGRPDTTVNNLVFGTMYIEHVGKMTVTNVKRKETCVLDFHAAGWNNANKHAVKGVVRTDDTSIVATIQGTWSDRLTYKFTNERHETLLW